MLKRILVALTGTPGGITAVRHAVDLAQIHDAKLTGVTLIDPRKIRNVGSVPIGAGSAARELREHRMTAAHEQYGGGDRALPVDLQIDGCRAPSGD